MNKIDSYTYIFPFYKITMEKYLINYTSKEKEKTTLELLDDQPLLQLQKPFVLGVLGYSDHAFWNQNTLLNDVILPLISEQDRIPTSLILPSEGATSLLLEAWSDRQVIQSCVYEADWAKLGKRAKALRDARIIKEATHLLLFLGKKSDYYEKIAIREVKKGKIVYCINAESHELIEYTS
jgi:hypothetical protein